LSKIPLDARAPLLQRTATGNLFRDARRSKMETPGKPQGR
jgi:hypothetical protein